MQQIIRTQALMLLSLYGVEEKKVKQSPEALNVFVDSIIEEITKALNEIVPEEKQDTWYHCREQIKENILNYLNK